jgi:hypothetical protein
MKRVASAINDTATGSGKCNLSNVWGVRALYMIIPFTYYCLRTSLTLDIGWFKIYEDGYDSSTKQWCTEKLMQNGGLLSADVPSDLAGGYYLARPELLSLHEADKSPPNPQFYAGCAQIYLDSSATSLPTDTVSIPGYVNITDASVLYNIYDPPSTAYVAPGPAPYQSKSTATTDISKSVKFSVQKSQTEGLLPSDAVITNGNWWGVEVPAYTTEDGCWAVSLPFVQHAKCSS